MKKVLTILMTLLCCFSFVLADGTDSKTTEVAYKVNEVYEWTVPSATEFAALATNQKLENEVGVTKCLISNGTALEISLDNAEGLNDMLLEYGGDKVAYEVALTEGGSALAAGDLVLTVASGELTSSGDGSSKTQNIYGKITGSPKKAGTYEDQLTFVAEVEIKNLTNFNVTFDETAINDWMNQISTEYPDVADGPFRQIGDGYFIDIVYDDVEYNQLSYDMAGSQLGFYKSGSGEFLIVYDIWNEPNFVLEGASIKITGGSDATNPDAVALLKSLGLLTE